MNTKNGLLSVEGKSLCFAYGRKRRRALENIDISVPKGFIYGLLGPSGCGKTTLLRCIVGRLKPNSGTIRVFGKIPGEAGFCIPGKGVGYMPQDLALYPEMSIEENLTYFGRLYQMKRHVVAERIAFLISLLDIPDKKLLIRELSGGQKRRASFAAALMHKPPLLILDEPTVGVDPLLRKSIWKHLKDLAREDNLTVMITTHYIEEARQADQVGLMREGRLLVQMNPEVLLKHHSVFTLEDAFLKLCLQDADEAHDGDTPSATDKFIINKRDAHTDDEHRLEIWIREESDNKSLALKELSQVSGEKNHSDVVLSIDPEYDVDTMYHNPNITTKLQESMTRMFTLIAKSFIRLKRNIVLAFFEIIVPLLQVVVFCLCIGNEPYDLPMAVVNMERDSTNYGQQFLSTLSNKTFQQKTYTDLSSAIESVKDGENWGAVYIGPAFTENMIDRFLDGSIVSNETISGSEIQLYLDMTNQQIASTIHANLVKNFQKFAENMLIEFGYNPRLAEAPIVLKDPVYGNRDPSFTEFMVPGMMLGITYIMALALTAMTVITEKKDGLLDRCLVAGVSVGEVIFSILLHLFLLVMLQITLVLSITFLIFDIEVVGSMAWVFVCTLLVGVSGMTLGLFISSVCPDENAAMVLAMGTFFPSVLLSGIIWPIQAMPTFLRYISYGLPMTLMARTLRSLLSRGWGILQYDTWHGVTVNISWSAALILLTWIVLRCKRYS